MRGHQLGDSYSREQGHAVLLGLGRHEIAVMRRAGGTLNTVYRGVEGKGGGILKHLLQRIVFIVVASAPLSMPHTGAGRGARRRPASCVGAGRLVGTQRDHPYSWRLTPKAAHAIRPPPADHPARCPATQHGSSTLPPCLHGSCRASASSGAAAQTGPAACPWRSRQHQAGPAAALGLPAHCRDLSGRMGAAQASCRIFFRSAISG